MHDWPLTLADGEWFTIALFLIFVFGGVIKSIFSKLSQSNQSKSSSSGSTGSREQRLNDLAEQRMRQLRALAERNAQSSSQTQQSTPPRPPAQPTRPQPQSMAAVTPHATPHQPTAAQRARLEALRKRDAHQRAIIEQRRLEAIRQRQAQQQRQKQGLRPIPPGAPAATPSAGFTTSIEQRSEQMRLEQQRRLALKAKQQQQFEEEERRRMSVLAGPPGEIGDSVHRHVADVQSGPVPVLHGPGIRLTGRESLRRAIILKELLDEPMGLRPIDEFGGW